MAETETGTDPRTPALTGWAVFAGTVLGIAGGINIIYGLAAIFRDDVLTSAGGGAVVIWDLTRWGWILFGFGTLQLLVGLGLFRVAGWARWFAIVLAGLNAIANVGFFTVYPLWTTLIVALDIIVIYQLSARWGVVGGDDVGGQVSYERRIAAASAARDDLLRMR
jgi:hypothetical protein